jgi:DNA-binding XRE family transcriptional regulator
MVKLAWNDGVSCVLDMTSILPESATEPTIEDWGNTLRFNGTIKDFSCTGLYKQAAWQEGRAPKPDDFRAWRKKMGLTQEQLADALDLSRRTIGYYEDGTQLVPRVVLLAIKGLEQEICNAA